MFLLGRVFFPCRMLYGKPNYQKLLNEQEYGIRMRKLIVNDWNFKWHQVLIKFIIYLPSSYLHYICQPYRISSFLSNAYMGTGHICLFTFPLSSFLASPPFFSLHVNVLNLVSYFLLGPVCLTSSSLFWFIIF